MRNPRLRCCAVVEIRIFCYITPGRSTMRTFIGRYLSSVFCTLLLCGAAFAVSVADDANKVADKSAENSAASEKPKSPSEFLGFTVGADRVLADYHQISDYMNALAANSAGRMQVLNLGKTTMGNDFQMVVISSAENIKNVA